MPGVSCQLGWTCEPRVVLSTAAQRAKQLQRGLHRQVVPAGGAAQDLGNQHESTILYFYLYHINDIIYIYINTSFFVFVLRRTHTYNIYILYYFIIFYLILVLYYIVIVMFCYVMLRFYLARCLSLSLFLSLFLRL